MTIEIKHRYTGTVLKTVNADSLSGANLWGADLSAQWIIQGATSSQGYAFFLQHLALDTEPMVKAGCFLGTVREARERWTDPNYHRGAKVGRELCEIVDGMLRVADIRGLK